MSRPQLPKRFVARTPDDFAAVAEQVGLYFWYRASRGDIAEQTSSGRYATGAYNAMQWLAGYRDVPPGSRAARLRTRYDLLDLLRVADLACFDDIDRWEDTVKGSPLHLEYFDRQEAAGARVVYEWALGISDTLPVAELLPEEARAARAYLDRYRRHLRRDAA